MIHITRRTFGFFGAAQVLALMSGKAWSLGSDSPPSSAAFDIVPYLNPELRSSLDPRLVMAGHPNPFTGQMLPYIRDSAAKLSAPPMPEPSWMERTIPGRAGAPNVRIFVINASTDRDTKRPAILHMHGGGFIIGNARAGIRALQETAKVLDCVIVTVDYRLSPETHFPGPLEDNYAGLKWLYDNAAELGVDKSRIALMGESAGGGHAAMLAIAARDRKEVPVTYQALVYPMLDDRTGSTRTLPSYMGAINWTPEANRFGWTSFLGVPAGSERISYGAVPARIENLKGLPPAFIGVGTIDLFVEEDIEYARRLIDVGIATELNVVPGAYHGFDMTDTALARQFRAALHEALRRAFVPHS
jgi:acetyl esterase/lipase